MTTHHDSDALGIKRLQPPRVPREWTVYARVPDGVAIDDHATHDALAAAAAPEGYVLDGTIPVRGRNDPADDPRSWRIRIRYIPASWQRPLRAPVSVYYAAQLAGVPTHLDDVLVVSHGSAQWYRPDGRPARCQSGCLSRHDLPVEIMRALSDIQEHDRRMWTGHYERKPDVLIAMQLREGSRQRAERAKAVIRDWIVTHYPHVVAEYGSD